MVKFIFQITKLIIILIMFFFFSSCVNSISLSSDGISGNGIVKVEKREISGKFKSVEVKTGIKLIIEQSENYSIEVKTDENVLQYLKTDIENGNLSIYFDKNMNDINERTVIVKMPLIERLTSSSGASIENISTLKSENLALKSSSGSEINLAVNVKKLVCESSSGSEIEAKGKANEVNTKSSSGSSIDLAKLETHAANCKSSSGSSTFISPLEILVAEASSGSSIKYFNTPKELTFDESSGGSVSKN